MQDTTATKPRRRPSANRAKVASTISDFATKPLFTKKEFAWALGVGESFLEKQVLENPEFPKPIALGGLRVNGRANQLRFIGDEVRAYLASLAQQVRVDCRVHRPAEAAAASAQC